jgi:hypothetical protein
LYFFKKNKQFHLQEATEAFIIELFQESLRLLPITMRKTVTFPLVQAAAKTSAPAYYPDISGDVATNTCKSI